MAKPMHDTERLGYDGAVDADGHVLEPPDMWERYIDPQHRDRALRIVRDERDLEELEIGGQRSLMSRRGFPSTLGAMGAPDMADIRRNPERTYLGEAPFGSMDPGERLAVLDAEGLDAVVLYTTIGLLWEAELDEPELCQAYTRAYNRWICEFCADSPRLVATAHLSLTDPAAAAAELERAVGDGAKGAYVAPFAPGGKPLGHPDHDPVFAAAQDLAVPFAIHPTFEPAWVHGSCGRPTSPTPTTPRLHPQPGRDGGRVPRGAAPGLPRGPGARSVRHPGRGPGGGAGLTAGRNSGSARRIGGGTDGSSGTGAGRGPGAGDVWRYGDMLREYRGDAHVAAWTAAGFDATRSA